MSPSESLGPEVYARMKQSIWTKYDEQVWTVKAYVL